MHSRRSPGQEKRPFAARYRRHAFEMSWFWQDMLPMYSKCPAKRRSGIHLAGILPSRRPFAVRIPQIMHDERILPRSTDPAGRILSRSMASPDESCHARWLHRTNLIALDGFCRANLAIPPWRLPLGKPRWANPVGQSTLDEANGFHLRVRHCHFHECPPGEST